MNKRIKITLIITCLILLIGVILYLVSYSPTEIIVLDHLTEMNDGVEDQICLVKNPPGSPEEMIAEIKAFNQANRVKGKYYDRLFIQEHDNDFLSTYFLDEELDYESKQTTRDDLDNIDFLATAYYQLTSGGSIMQEISCSEGEGRLYDK